MEKKRIIEQRMLDEAADQAATQASALVIAWIRQELKQALKSALKEIYWQLWRDLFTYLIKARWFKVVTGGLTLISAAWYWIKDHVH